VSYAMGVSLDGYIAGPDGGIDWTAPDEELHRFHNERAREMDLHLYGRRMYEVMRFWETAAENPAMADYEVEFAEIWQRTPRFVFSTTLASAERGARLVLVALELGARVAAVVLLLAVRAPQQDVPLLAARPPPHGLDERPGAGAADAEVAGGLHAAPIGTSRNRLEARKPAR